MASVDLECSCGTVKGTVKNCTPSSGNHVVCCCSDCQQFAKFLERSDDVLDEFGGTALYQTSQSQLVISSGHEQLRCMRLSEKGLLRWYTGCCNTPVGNTISASMPFVGVFVTFIKNTDVQKTLGPVRAYVQTQYAISSPDYPHSAQKFPLGITLRIIRKMLYWKIRGMNKPSALFNEDGAPVSTPKIAQ